MLFQAFPGEFVSCGSGKAAPGADDHGISFLKGQTELFQFLFIVT